MTRCIIFDLDGTLVKSHKTIYKTTIKTLEILNLSTDIDEQKFYSLLGHHFADIFRGCKIEVPDVEHFIDIYKNLYFDFIDQSILYENVEHVLNVLKSNGTKIGLLTTKGQDLADKICVHFKIDKFFDTIEGRKHGIAIKPAPDQLLKICNELEVDPKNTIMVGDTELDIKCGKSAGAKTCAVSFGYRKVDELKKLGSDYLIDDFTDILNFN